MKIMISCAYVCVLCTLGYVPASDSGPKLFTAPGASQDDIQKLVVTNTTTVDDLDLALEEAGFVRAPPVGVVLRYPGARGQEDLKQVLKQEVTQGADLQEALYTAGKLTQLLTSAKSVHNLLRYCFVCLSVC